MVELVRYKYGRTAAKFPVELTALHNLVTFPAPAAVWPGPNDALFNYGMLGNDQYGDCTFAGFVHLVQAVCIFLGVKPPAPTSAAVVKAYLLYNHGQDVGASEADVLGALYTTGILDINLAGYANGRRGLEELWQITQYGGAAYLGIQVPAPCQQQFAAGEPWDLTGTSADNEIEGGHCVVNVAFNQNQEMAEVITWGRRQKVTFRWLDRYLDEQWMAIPEQVKASGHLGELNWAQLAADMKALHGKVHA